MTKKRMEEKEPCNKKRKLLASDATDGGTGSHNNDSSKYEDGENSQALASQHSMYLGSIIAACEATNASQTKPYRTDEEKRAERLAANRRSARESRNRKKTIFDDLQKSVTRFAAENNKLRDENAALKKEIEALKQSLAVSNRKLLEVTTTQPPEGDITMQFPVDVSSVNNPRSSSQAVMQGLGRAEMQPHTQGLSVFNADGFSESQMFPPPQQTTRIPLSSQTPTLPMVSSSTSGDQGGLQQHQLQLDQPQPQGDPLWNMTLQQIALLATTQQKQFPAGAAPVNQANTA